jgi:hypothetical protein
LSLPPSDILEGNPEEVIGDPVSVLESMHKTNAKDGDHYFNVDDGDWVDESGQEEPLTWSLNEPGCFCDWTIEVIRIRNSPSSSSRFTSGKDKKYRSKVSLDRDKVSLDRDCVEKSRTQYYHVHKAILSVG